MGSIFGNVRHLKIKPVFTIGAEASNEIAIAVQLVDRENGNEIGEAVSLLGYITSDSAGQTLATAPDGGTVVGTDGLFIPWTAGLAGLMTSEADGDLDLILTESSTGSWYLNLVMPDGKLYTSGAMTFA